MSIPTILGACILQIPDLAGASLTGSEILNYVIGMIVAGVVGFLCIKVMLKSVKNNKFIRFRGLRFEVIILFGHKFHIDLITSFLMLFLWRSAI